MGLLTMINQPIASLVDWLSDYLAVWHFDVQETINICKDLMKWNFRDHLSILPAVILNMGSIRRFLNENDYNDVKDDDDDDVVWLTELRWLHTFVVDVFFVVIAVVFSSVVWSFWLNCLFGYRKKTILMFFFGF